MRSEAALWAHGISPPSLWPFDVMKEEEAV